MFAKRTPEKRSRGDDMEQKNDGATGYGKDAERKSQTTDFPSPLGNPANPAGFQLSHSPDDYEKVLQSKSSITYEKGDTSNVVTRGTFLMSVDNVRPPALTQVADGDSLACCGRVSPKIKSNR
jgi:hypothetical protein